MAHNRPDAEDGYAGSLFEGCGTARTPIEIAVSAGNCDANYSIVDREPTKQDELRARAMRLQLALDSHHEPRRSAPAQEPFSFPPDPIFPRGRAARASVR